MELKILIIDDDKRLLSSLKSFLMEENPQVTTCQNGLEAIQKLRQDNYDLVITDLMLPGADGFEILKEARKIHPDTLVVLITGYASLESAIQAIREGAYDYIAKPFKLEEIRILIHNASERIHLARENARLIGELRSAYAQLQGVKEVIGLGKNDSLEALQAVSSQSPFIAGSMLPLFCQDNTPVLSPVVLSDLERISTLQEKGFISDEEFQLCKSRLLKHLRH